MVWSWLCRDSRECGTNHVKLAAFVGDQFGKQQHFRLSRS